MNISQFKFFQFIRMHFLLAVLLCWATQSYAINIALLGEPGSGKGTLAEKLSAHYGIPIISGSEIVTRLGNADPHFKAAAQAMRQRGELLPDTPEYMGRVLQTFADRVSEPDCKLGFISDGIPRTAWQVTELNKILAARGKGLDGAILVQVLRQTIYERLAGRRVCSGPGCGKVYHVVNLPPLKDGFCNDPCGCALVARPDDSPEAVKVRLAIYDQQMDPVIDLYRNSGLLIPVDGNGTPQVVFEATKSALAGRGFL